VPLPLPVPLPVLLPVPLPVLLPRRHRHYPHPDHYYTP
jgi:hypothetical protein